MHVRVDEPGHDIAPGGVDDLASVVSAESRDPTVGDGDVDLEPLACENGKHASAANDDVGGLVAASDGEASRKVLHAGRSYYPSRGGRAHPPHARRSPAYESRARGGRSHPGRHRRDG